ncbi:8056_t:CDS:2 [Paraglomus brasilianum]|uniref:8056_t:CDS:1 n=1 Tax=Paraglomus brasilianum TaxID=144538 RepID=A0A9N9ASC4_9GLOM|nr:8056_t:CDS:2 [Paraglomus brasilianum]
MSASDQALRQALESNRQLSNLKVQIASKEREKRMTELTKKELAALDSNVITYKTVGKAFFRTDLPLLVNDMDKGVEKAATEIEVLDKKKKYLERHINEAQTGLKEVLGRQ